MKTRLAYVGIDLVRLRAVFNWAAKWRTPQGRYLMRENPTRGYPMPRQRTSAGLSPRRTDTRPSGRSRTSTPFTERGGALACVPEAISTELLDIVNGTGRRIAAVCSLRYDDRRLERTKLAPHGAIRWPAATDKMGRETVVPLSPTVRAAIDRVLRDRPGLGSVPLFPALETPTQPMERHLANKWLREAEKCAGLEPLRGGLWHPYRRKWATERKGMPEADVAASGGWLSTATLKLYQQVDEATMLAVVLGGAELREAK